MSANQPSQTLMKDMHAAMPGEIKSWAEYLAFADQAERAGHHELAQVWTAISHVERYDHFYHQAELAGFLQQDNAQNVQQAMNLAQQHHDQYQQYAQQASSAGEREAANLFNQLADDEKQARDRFNQALRALQSNGQVPSAPEVQQSKIQQGKPSVQGQTHQNLKDTMKMTAYASGLYWLFARRAVTSVQPDLGALLLSAAEQEMHDHFARAANLAGLVGSTEENLHESIKGETTAHRQYANAAHDAQQSGNQHAHRFFQGAAADEDHHKQDFEIFLQRLTGQKTAA